MAKDESQKQRELAQKLQGEKNTREEGEEGPGLGSGGMGPESSGGEEKAP